MAAADLRMVAVVLRERARPMPDGDGRSLLGTLADILDESATRIETPAPPGKSR
jgi:hypothetical protein